MLKENGMEVMNHSSAHGHMNQMSSEEIIADIKKCNDQIEALTGECPTLFRAPYGEYDDHVIAAVRSIGMEPIQWDVDSLDWKEISAGEIYERVTSRVKPGSIILFHNAGLNTPEALPDILEYLIGEGYEVVPVSQILLDGEYITTTKPCIIYVPRNHEHSPILVPELHRPIYHFSGGNGGDYAKEANSTFAE